MFQMILFCLLILFFPLLLSLQVILHKLLIFPQLQLNLPAYLFRWTNNAHVLHENRERARIHKRTVKTNEKHTTANWFLVVCFGSEIDLVQITVCSKGAET